MRTAIFAAVLVAALRAESTSEHSSEVAHIAFDWGGTRGLSVAKLAAEFGYSVATKVRR